MENPRRSASAARHQVHSLFGPKGRAKMGNGSSLALAVLLSVLVVVGAQVSRPLRCHDPSRVCSSYLYYMLSSNESRADVASLFNVSPQDLTLDPRRGSLDAQGLYIRVNCSCVASVYLASTFYNATSSSIVASVIAQVYDHLAWASNTSLPVISGRTVPISLLCGCLDNTRDYGYLLSYVVQSHDSLDVVALRFESSIPDIDVLNNVTNENVIYPNQVYYLPINIAPLVTPVVEANAPYNVPPPIALLAVYPDKNVGFPLKMVLGIVGGTCMLILVAIGVLLFAKKVVFRRNSFTSTQRKSTMHRWVFL